MPENPDHLSRIFLTLANPVRRHILTCLVDGPATTPELSHRCRTKPPTTSRHLRHLEGEGLIVREQNQWRTLTTDPGTLSGAAGWLSFIKGDWAEWQDLITAHNRARRELAAQQDRSEDSPLVPGR